MTLTEPASAGPSEEMSRDGSRPARRGHAWLALILLYLAAVVTYVVLGQRAKLPLMMPDELEYQHLARSLAGGHGFDWRGETFGLHAALYVYAITPAWLLSGGESPYGLAKALGAVLMCL